MKLNPLQGWLIGPLRSFFPLLLSFPLLAFAASTSSEGDSALFLGKATIRVAHAMAFKNIWDGPTNGPKLATSKTIAFIGADLGDPSQQRLANAVKEVTASVGWSTAIWDCYGLAARQADAMARAMALKPAAIIFAGTDAKANAAQIAIAASKKIPVIGWNAAPALGATDGLFTNIGTEPKEAGQLAAMLGIVESKAKAGFVVLADNSTPYLAAKTQAMIDTIKQCPSCALLSVEEPAIAEKPEVAMQRMVDLQKQFGTHLTYVMATNDRLFDFLATPAASAIDGKLEFISAGYGSASAYTRIRAKKGQMGTVAEPLNLQAWQMIDEINRALAGEKPSGFAPAPYVVTLQNIAFYGGTNNAFEPSDGYQSAYKSIWGR
ncbi:MAG: substrate-binding domain-containing protein [Burkholderiaceae bacterium]|nr:substrate-binding domain-containing protein [Burkholderiaceae bacterium]